jgi:hypothetical protein
MPTNPIKTAIAVLGAALVMMLAFGASYVGAFHEPKPHRVPVELVAPAAIASRTAAQLEALPGAPIQVDPARSIQAAIAQVDGASAYGVFDAAANELYVASAANRATATALELTFTRIAAAEHHPAPRITDLKPLPPSDPNGTAPFYAVLAWVFGGYLGATLLGLAGSPRSHSRRLAAARIGGLGVFAAVGSLLSLAILSEAIGVLGSHFVSVWAIGALVIFASGVATAGLQAAAGMLGTGVVILLFVIIGNAASGGPYARPLLPGFWRTIGGILPPGAGVDLVRATAYFGGSRITGPILVLLGWTVLGAVLAIAFGGRVVNPAAVEAEAAAAAAAA